ncbi:STAS domain-containing protein [Methanoregula sp. UBA64]|jgi:anti-sigma B factor antagonist|uniref:STAS domain-containing protein n=1 Tax=Methanoregula sp. UBA64 TaxID=1915554 RepID=UPI0025D50136|nr:STAS domain-containing protein [Methanoregula sp. UBA64]
MDIRYTGMDGMLVAAISGRFDNDAVPEFKSARESWPVAPTVLDLSGLTYLSSSGLRELLALRRDFSRQGVPVVIAGSTGFVSRILTVSGFAEVFVTYPTVADAAKAISCGGA